MLRSGDGYRCRSRSSEATGAEQGTGRWPDDLHGRLEGGLYVLSDERYHMVVERAQVDAGRLVRRILPTPGEAGEVTVLHAFRLHIISSTRR